MAHGHTTKSAATDYRPNIDGLRCIAVMAVLTYHSGVLPISGGFVGVDIFFVISGYLITSILPRKLDEDSFTLTGFYVRRAKRLFPALFVVLLVCSALAYQLLLPNALYTYGKSLVAAA